MAIVTFKTTENRIEGRLNSMISKGRDCRALLNGTIYPMMVNAQVKRWETENTSETGQWLSLNPKYKEYKRKKYRSYPESGERIMIATGTLIKKSSAELMKVVTTRGMVLSIDGGAVPYAKYAAEVRTVMRFGNDTIDKIRVLIKTYLTGR
jgi:adenylosuccinate synthase